MDNNEVILQPEIKGSVVVRVGRIQGMNFLCPEDDYGGGINNVNIIAEKDKEFIQNFKCCGNCCYYEIDLEGEIYNGHSYCLCRNEHGVFPYEICENWQWNNRAFKDRVIGD
jgi:hypothetical protein